MEMAASKILERTHTLLDELGNQPVTSGKLGSVLEKIWIDQRIPEDINPQYIPCFAPLLVQDDLQESTHKENCKALARLLVNLLLATLHIKRSHRLQRVASDEITHLFHYSKPAIIEAVFPFYPEVGEGGKNNKILLSPTASLNDPAEGRFFFDRLEKVFEDASGFFKDTQNENIRHLVNNIKKHIDERSKDMRNLDDPIVFTASLCNAADDLNLWRFYGDHGKGVSFGIPVEEFDLETTEEEFYTFQKKDKKAKDKGSSSHGRDPVYKIEYGIEAVSSAATVLFESLRGLSELLVGEPEIPASILSTTINSVCDILDSISHLYKARAYSEEKEFRILHTVSLRDLEGIRIINDNIYCISRTKLVPNGSKLYIGPCFRIDEKNDNREAARVSIQCRLSQHDESAKQAASVFLSTLEYRSLW